MSTPRGSTTRALLWLTLGLGWGAAPCGIDAALPALAGRALADASQLQLLDELAEWVEEGASTETTWRGAIRSRATSFDLFRRYHPASARRELLERLPFGETIEQAGLRHGVDGLLLAAIVEAESRFDPGAVSHRGAVGLMQIMPTIVPAELRPRLVDPEVNVDLGAAYVRQLLDRYEGDLELALAAYNAGPTNVRRYGGLPPFAETRRYVEGVLEAYVGHHRELWRSGDSRVLAELLLVDEEGASSRGSDRRSV